MTVSQSDEIAASTYAGVLPPSVKGAAIRRIHEYSPALPGRGNPVASTHSSVGKAILGHNFEPDSRMTAHGAGRSNQPVKGRLPRARPKRFELPTF